MTDFGLYAAVAGFIGFASFFSGALNTVTQRQLSVSFGRNADDAPKVFGTCVALHLGLAAGLVAGLFVIKNFYLGKIISGADGRSAALNWAFMAAALQLGCQIVSTPYYALYIAKERISATALIDFLVSGGQFILAIFLAYVPTDRLLAYSTGLLILAFLNLAYLAIRASIEFDLARDVSRWRLDRKLLAETSGLAAWNIFGALAFVGRLQGCAVILNAGFGALVSAAYAVAQRTATFHTMISLAVRTASMAQITELYATGRVGESVDVASRVGKHSFMLTILWLIPLSIEIDWVLNFWLREVPPQTSSMITILLSALTVELLTAGFMVLAQATGRIAAYQAVLGTLLFLPVPVGFFYIKSGGHALGVVWLILGFTTLSTVMRIIMVARLVKYSLWPWIRGTIPRLIFACIAQLALPWTAHVAMSAGWGRFGTVLLASTLSWGALYYLIVADGKERSGFSRSVSALLRIS
jgi:hypothetical protein